jgi:hypothetical protein
MKCIRALLASSVRGGVVEGGGAMHRNRVATALWVGVKFLPSPSEIPASLRR